MMRYGIMVKPNLHFRWHHTVSESYPECSPGLGGQRHGSQGRVCHILPAFWESPICCYGEKTTCSDQHLQVGQSQIVAMTARFSSWLCSGDHQVEGQWGQTATRHRPAKYSAHDASPIFIFLQVFPLVINKCGNKWGGVSRSRSAVTL